MKYFGIAMQPQKHVTIRTFIDSPQYVRLPSPNLSPENGPERCPSIDRSSPISIIPKAPPNDISIISLEMQTTQGSTATTSNNTGNYPLMLV